MSRRAVFLDRDGTLIREMHFLRRPEDIELMPRAAEALRMLVDLDLRIVLVSNQSGVARGLFGEDAVREVNEALAALLEAEGIHLDGIYYCPHHPQGTVPEYARDCACRKPGPGMVDRAARDLHLQLEGSWMVGDKADDVRIAETRPLRPVLVRTGYGREAEAKLAGFPGLILADDLLAAARHIARAEQG